MLKRLRYLDYLLHSAAAQYRAYQHIQECSSDHNNLSEVYKDLHRSFIDEFNGGRYFWMKQRKYQIK